MSNLKDNFSKPSSRALVSEHNLDNPDQKNGYENKGFDFLGDSGRDSVCRDELSQSKFSKIGYSRSQPQELTLSYLCDNSKLGFSEKDFPRKDMSSSSEKISFKGKEVVSDEQDRFVERDFLRLNSLKREVETEEEETDRGKTDKKPKLETLNLSLGLPNIAVSVAASSDPIHNSNYPAQVNPARSSQSLQPSSFQAMSYSNDFTGTSLSFSNSQQYSHNPSCSLTRNSTEWTFGSTQWRDCGEGTNGSVHSRFRPVGDRVVLANNKDPFNASLYRTTSSENLSFFPSELPAKQFDNLRGLTSSGPFERILQEIVSGSVHVVAQMIQELTGEIFESTKEYLKNLIVSPDKRDELTGLQKQVERRSDLTRETLLRSNKNHLEFLVSIKTGVINFLSEPRLPSTELIDIFLFEKCRNINCKRPIPADDCDCKICSMKNGFCSECMCPVCFNFDSANNTCSWVGCDVCSHWCHTDCGIQRNLIKSGPCLNADPAKKNHMQFNCMGCGHASEMFGFVKDVFMACANNWGVEDLKKELDCVKRIFRRSEDFKGKDLFFKAGELIFKLEKKMISPSEACSFIFRFFNDAEETRKGDNSVRNLNEVERSHVRENVIEDEWSVKFPKKGGFESLESVVRVKEMEAKMYESKADEARREGDGFKRMVMLKKLSLEEEYNNKVKMLRLDDYEETRRKKEIELKNLEDSHCDYYKMKLRMQAEIAGLLERMETTKQQWVL